MGRASRKKKRIRAIEGGIYSNLFYDSDMRKDLKNILKKNPEQFKEFIRTKDPFIDNNVSTAENLSLILGSNADFIKQNCDYKNYFISSENVSKFVEENKTRTIDLFNVKDIIKELCILRSNEMMDFEYYAGVFHIINKKYSIMFIYTELNGQHIIYYESANPNNNKSLWCTAILPESAPETEEYNIINGGERVKNLTDNLRDTIINLFLYMDAFPESVIHGAPPVKYTEYFKGLSNVEIKSNEVIDSMYSRNISAHLRRGHYRFLKSDRYKNKRFQTVFVRPTMVKGTADHIIESENFKEA